MGGSSKSQTIGYRYYAGMHQVYAMSPDDFPVQEISRIRVGDETVWTGSVTANGTINVHAPNAFGGEKKEGGVVGAIDVMFGRAAQTVNSYLASRLTGYPVPAFRGVFSLALRQVYLAAMNYYLKPWAVYARRNVSPWYSAKSAIGEDINAAHAIRHLLSDATYGLGATAFDDTAFMAAADTLHAEGLGVSVRWQSDQQTIESLVQELAHAADAYVYEDQASGQWRIKLARDDYTLGALPILDRSTVERVERFTQPMPGDLSSEVVLTYTDRDTGKQAAVSAHDIAIQALQGVPVRTSLDMPFVPTGALAARIVARELRQRGTPLAKVTLICNRAPWSLNIGDVFRWQWPEYGIADMVMRVASVGRGTLADGRIRIEAVQDIFSVASAIYASPPPSGWVSPISPPSASPSRRLIEAPYWLLVRDVVGEWPSLWADLDPLSGLLLAAASRPTSDAYDYRLYTRAASAPFEDRAAGAWCPVAELAAGIGPTDTVLAIVNGIDLDLIEAGDTALASLGDELVRVAATGSGTVTVSRGVLDTVPASHAAGAKLHFLGASASYGIDPTEWLSGQTVNAKLLTRTGLGTLAEGVAPTDSLVMSGRYIRPYPPGNVQINATAWPASVSGDLAITWVHRDRTLQTAYLVAQTEASIGPEPGTTYTVRIYNAQTGGSLIRTYSGITGTSQAYTVADATTDNGGSQPANLRIEIEAVRDGYLSWQRQVRSFGWS